MVIPVQPATDFRVRSLGTLALVYSNAREQLEKPLGAPSHYAPRLAADYDELARRAERRLKEAAKKST